MKYPLRIPIFIPSVKRDGRETLTRCLESIDEFYIPKEVYVLLQGKYSDEEVMWIKNRFPYVRIQQHELFSDKLVGAYRHIHDFASFYCDRYIFIEDDIKLISTGGFHYPSLYAIQRFMEENLKLGVIASLPRNLQRADSGPFFRFTGNPAQVIGFNSQASKKFEFSNDFFYFRTDTDLSLQVVKEGYGLMVLTRFFTHYHMNPISKKAEGKGYSIKYDDTSRSTNKRTPEEWIETEKRLANKWGLKLNKNGRAMYEQFVKRNNPLNYKNIIVPEDVLFNFGE